MKEKGFTLLEMMIVVAIIAILSTVATVSMKGRAEKNAKIEVKNMIPMFLNNAIDRAFEEGAEYTIDMNNINSATYPIIKMGPRKVVLPTVLKYESSVTEVKITQTGKFFTSEKCI